MTEFNGSGPVAAAGGRGGWMPTERERVAAIAAAIACVAVVGIGLSLSIPLLPGDGAAGGVEHADRPQHGDGRHQQHLVVPFVPRVASRIGVVPLLTLSLIVSAASLVAFPLLPGLWPWFPLRFVFSAGLGALFVLSEYWINAAAPRSGGASSSASTHTVLALGFATGRC